MGNKGGFKISTGASSILMIFVILCLTTFAVLSYVTANADHKLTERANENITRYYSADSQAQKVLSDIDSTLKKFAEFTSDALKNDLSKMDSLNIKDTVKIEITGILNQNDLTEETKLDWIYNALVTNSTFTVNNSAAEISSSAELNPVISFEITVSDTHKLCISLEVWPLSSNQEKLYKIVKYQNVSTVEQPEETPNLWEGPGSNAE